MSLSEISATTHQRCFEAKAIPFCAEFRGHLVAHRVCLSYATFCTPCRTMGLERGASLGGVLSEHWTFCLLSLVNLRRHSQGLICSRFSGHQSTRHSRVRETPNSLPCYYSLYYIHVHACLGMHSGGQRAGGRRCPSPFWPMSQQI